MLTLLAACERGTTSDRPRSIPGPTLVVRESLTVRESDSLFLARPYALFADQQGNLLVSDLFFDRAVLFDRSGVPRRVFGSQGAGPGEVTNIGVAFRVGDSLVAVADEGRKAFKLFQYQTGAFRGQLAYEGLLRFVFIENNVVWLGARNLPRNTGVLRWDAPGGEMRYVVPLPSEYGRSPRLAGVYSGVMVTHWADTLLTGAQGTNFLTLARADGSVLQRVQLPRVARRGVPPDIVGLLARRRMNAPQFFSLMSALFLIGRRSDGRFVLVHSDQNVIGRLITARVFVSLLSADRREACVDAELPVYQDAQPIFAWVADTLLVLQQRLVAGQPSTLVQRLSVEDNACRWLPTEPVSH